MDLLEPLVSVLTPVLNGESFLKECIESVLAQDYQNYEYIIVNNCSTDNTLEIARSYANRDCRIRIVNNESFVGVIENHNKAFNLISPQSKYCKVLSADDWIYPECIAKLVQLAERSDAIGMVGSYAINSRGIRQLGLPYGATIFDGREVSRLYLLGKVGFLGTPSGVLYRSDLVRTTHSFYPGADTSADVAACLNCLQRSDFGFVHQILYFERIHEKSLSAIMADLNPFVLHALRLLKSYGPLFLTRDELNGRLKKVLSQYYSVLATGLANLKGRKFWDYHRSSLNELGYSLYGFRLAKAVCIKLVDLLFNPKQTVEKMLRHAKAKRHPRETAKSKDVQIGYP